MTIQRPILRRAFFRLMVLIAIPTFPLMVVVGYAVEVWATEWRDMVRDVREFYRNWRAAFIKGSPLDSLEMKAPRPKSQMPTSSYK